MPVQIYSTICHIASVAGIQPVIRLHSDERLLDQKKN